MTDGSYVIRDSIISDLDAVRNLYPKAFPEENLLPLINQLYGGADNVHSFVCLLNDNLIGHASFTDCSIKDTPLSLLAPVAVAPDHQRKGIGSALINKGLDFVREKGALAALVLGDPNYYAQFGFTAESRIAPPYAIPESWKPAWQSLYFTDPQPDCSGPMQVPSPWQNAALWT